MRSFFRLVAGVGVMFVGILLLLSIGETLLLTSAANLELGTTPATIEEVRELDNGVLRIWYSYKVEGKTYRGAYSVPSNGRTANVDGDSGQIEASYFVVFPSYSYVSKEYSLRKSKFGIAAFSLFLAILVFLYRKAMANSESFERYRKVFATPKEKKKP